jgi:hypothetical protein
MTIEELIDYVQQDLTMSCALPKILPDMEIRRLAMKDAMPWFYENYSSAVLKVYYVIPRKNFQRDPGTGYSCAILPDEIQTVTWLFPVTDRSLFQLGVNAPNLSINLGVTNQPYLSSYVTTVGELGVYKTIIDGFSDVLNTLSKHTLKFDFNFNSKQLNILTSLTTNVIAEAYCKIDAEDLFNSDKFRRYLLGLSKRQLGNLLTRYNFQLPGGIQLNGDAIRLEGVEELEKVRDEVKGESQSSWFFMVKR